MTCDGRVASPTAWWAWQAVDLAARRAEHRAAIGQAFR